MCVHSDGFCTDIGIGQGNQIIMTIDGSIRKYDFWCGFCFFGFSFLAFGCAMCVSWVMIRNRARPAKHTSSIFLRKKQLKRILILYRFKSNKHHICSSICSLNRFFFFSRSFIHSFIFIFLNFFFSSDFCILCFGFAAAFVLGAIQIKYIWVGCAHKR